MRVYEHKIFQGHQDKVMITKAIHRNTNFKVILKIKCNKILFGVTTVIVLYV